MPPVIGEALVPRSPNVSEGEVGSYRGPSFAPTTVGATNGKSWLPFIASTLEDENEFYFNSVTVYERKQYLKLFSNTFRMPQLDLCQGILHTTPTCTWPRFEM